jgi:hypothetical protein
MFSGAEVAGRGIPTKRTSDYEIPLPFTKAEGEILANAPELLRFTYISQAVVNKPV